MKLFFNENLLNLLLFFHNPIALLIFSVNANGITCIYVEKHIWVSGILKMLDLDFILTGAYRQLPRDLNWEL